MDFRDRIKAVINERPELTVRKVSLEAGLSDSALHKLLTGSTKSPTLETLEKLAYALDVDARWLAYGEGDPERATDLGALIERMSQDDQEQAYAVLKARADRRSAA